MAIGHSQPDVKINGGVISAAVPPWAHRIGLQQLSRSFILAGLSARLLLWAIGPRFDLFLPLIPLVLCCGVATAGMALLAGQWAGSKQPQLWPSLLALVLCSLVVLATGGTASWYIPFFPIFAVSEAAFQTPRRAWVLSGLAVGCLATPLVYAWTPGYLVTLALGTVVIIGATRWVTLVRQDIIAALRLASAARADRLTESLDFDETLRSTVALVRELLEPTTCILYLLAAEQEQLVPSYVFLDPRSYGPEEREAVLRFSVRVGEGLIGAVAASGEELLISDVTADPRVVPIPGKPFRPQSAIVVPLQYAHEMLGVMRVSRDGVGLYGPSDLAVIRVLANQAAIAIANCRLYEATRQAEAAARASEQRYERLTDHAGEAVVVVDIHSLDVEYVNRAAQRLIGYDLADFQADRELLASRLAPGGRQVMQRGLSALLEGVPVVTDLVAEWLDRNDCGIVMQHTLLPLRDEHGQVRAVECLCRDITDQLRMEQELEQLARFDKLTGVHNRLYFEERLRELASEPGQPLSIILGDLNGLKLVNDAFGHQAGDQLLRTTAQIIQRAVREQDTVCRWGGDEFAVIVSRGGHRQAHGILERLRAELAAESAGPIPLSVAFGTASCDDASTADLSALMREAENRMYHNKLLEAKSTQSAIIASLQKTLQEKTHETAAHAARLQQLCELIARQLGLSDDVMVDLSLLALLHDIGKVGIPDHVLANTGSLSPAEWEVMRRHPEIGYRIATATPSLAQLAEYILAHHERWDGQGYPRGLPGEEIPLASRILAIADAYDTMTNGRPYREPISAAAALAELVQCAGKQFDPKLVRLFRRAILMGPAAAGAAKAT